MSVKWELRTLLKRKEEIKTLFKNRLGKPLETFDSLSLSLKYVKL
jgi:hypothetical protein